jgi:hypothetical protein
LFDDPILTSPELALVDADLAAQLRADLSSGDAFSPRQVARPAYLELVFDVGEPDQVRDDPLGDEPDEDPVDVVEVPSAYVVLPDESADEVPLDRGRDASETFDLPPLLTVDERSDELPDYIVRADEVVADAMPDYVVVGDDDIGAAAAEYVVPREDEIERFVPDRVRGDEIVPDSAVEASAGHAQSSSDYPVLPDLDERSDALEETEAALRRIREQLGGGAEPAAIRRSRLRRRFTIGSGLCVAAVLATYAADVQLGIVHAPGWLAL